MLDWLRQAKEAARRAQCVLWSREKPARLDRCPGTAPVRTFLSGGRLSGGTNRNGSVSGLALLLVIIVACAAPAPAHALEPPYELVINGVVDSALDDLLLQMRRLPAFAPRPTSSTQEGASAPGEKDASARPRAVIAVDRTVDKIGLRSVASEVVDSLLLETARHKLTEFELIDASPALAGRAQYILGGKLTPLDAVSTSRGTFRVDLLLTELKTSYVVAQVSVRFTAEGVDLRPLNCCVNH
jgi:hypothetical protein